MLQWSARQVHDTVAAIVSRPEFTGGRTESIFGKLLRFVFRKLNDVLDWARGSVDARIIVGSAVGIVLLIVAARVMAERRALDAGARRVKGRGAHKAGRDRWSEAREFASAGEYTDAAHALYGAVLDTLRRDGLVRYHPSKTNGDYTRELRRGGSAVASEFRAFGRDFDRAAFGSDAVSRDEYAQLLAAADRIARIVAAARNAA